MIMNATSEYAGNMAATSGASAYFSAPEHSLDPALFSSDNRLNPGVRDEILGALFDFLRHENIQAGSWLHAWLAGSGISYQWRASRGNGDLDVLLGVQVPGFLAINPGFAAGDRAGLAGVFNEQMKKYLWPLTAATTFGGTTYEVTYYWNPQVSNDIDVIRPYAAWDLMTSDWTVPPDPEPTVRFPRDWHIRAGEDALHIRRLYSQWSQHMADILLLPPDNPAAVTAASALRRVTGELRSIWDVIHDGRRSAFTGNGEGWGDWHNFRWQAAKLNGTTGLLREVITDDDRRRAADDTRLYGGPIAPGEVALRRAAAAHSRWLR